MGKKQRKQRSRGGGVANSNLSLISTESDDPIIANDFPLDDGKYLISSQADDFDYQHDEERRFLWLTTGWVGNREFETRCSDNGMSMPHDGGLAKHQVNYSATKYIKP